ncbi:MAG: Permease of the drug/metabolite transporter (DMT) superfamily, partial [uncultured Actinomycetospora sp.]
GPGGTAGPGRKHRLRVERLRCRARGSPRSPDRHRVLGTCGGNAVRRGDRVVGGGPPPVERPGVRAARWCRREHRAGAVLWCAGPRAGVRCCAPGLLRGGDPRGGRRCPRRDTRRTRVGGVGGRRSRRAGTRDSPGGYDRRAEPALPRRPTRLPRRGGRPGTTDAAANGRTAGRRGVRVGLRPDRPRWVRWVLTALGGGWTTDRRPARAAADRACRATSAPGRSPRSAAHAAPRRAVRRGGRRRAVDRIHQGRPRSGQRPGLPGLRGERAARAAHPARTAVTASGLCRARRPHRCNIARRHL